MIVKLLVTLKVRENGENVLLTPGLYDTESQNFPEALKGESRFGVVEIIKAGVAAPAFEKVNETEPEEDEELPEEEEEEEEIPKKKKDKKRGR